MASPDGSVARRFAVLALLVALAISVAMSLRKGRIPGTAAGPSRRIVGITIISFLAMMFTPTKWTHHFGVFAGLAGSLGALAAVAVTASRCVPDAIARVFAAVVLFVVALSFASVNGWWYVSNFGVPWSNSFPQWHYAFATVLLALTVLVLLLAAWFHFVAHRRRSAQDPVRRCGRIIQSPLAIATWMLVIFEVVSLTSAMTTSTRRGRWAAPTCRRSPGSPADWPTTCWWSRIQTSACCPRSRSGRGRPGSRLLRRLHAQRHSRRSVSADPVMERPGDRSFVSDDSKVTSSEAGTEGGTTAAPGINGSRARLPYHLDPARTPVLGSWRSGIQVPARLRSGWYRLPPNDQRASPARCWWYRRPAGSTPGRSSCNGPPTTARRRTSPAAHSRFGDVGASPAWRNLRAPLSAIPADATQVRVVADDEDLAPQHWIARHPAADSAAAHAAGRRRIVGSRCLLDWLVGLAFPCQRPFGHRNGVDETPKWRILPDRFGAEANSPVMDNNGGGPLGVTELLVKATTVASYLKDDWSPGLGCVAAADALLPGRRARPTRARVGDPQRPVEPGAAQTIERWQ